MEIFVTGSTGLVGSHLINALSKINGINRIYALVRTLKTPILCENKKVVLLKGDITLPNLGLKKGEMDNLRNVREVYHLAASVSLSNKEENKSLIYDVNVNGTAHLLDLFKNNKNLKKLFYVSSAYSGGCYNKKVPENWLAKPKHFRNYYESTKFDAEQSIKKYSDKHNIPYIILRPSILLSGSAEDLGKTKSPTIYLYGWMLYRILKEIEFKPIKIRLLGDPNSTLNLIFVRDLIDLLMYIRDTEMSNSILNVVNPANTPIKDILLSIKKGLSYRGEFTFVNKLKNPTELELRALELTEPFTKYTLDRGISWETKKSSIFKNKISNHWIKSHIEEYFQKVVSNEK